MNPKPPADADADAESVHLAAPDRAGRATHGARTGPDDLGGEVRSRLHASMAGVHVAEPPVASARGVLQRAQAARRHRQHRARAVVALAVLVVLLGTTVAVSRARQEGPQGVDAGAPPSGGTVPGSVPPSSSPGLSTVPPTTVVVPAPTSVVAPDDPVPRRGRGTVVALPSTTLPPMPVAPTAASVDGVPRIVLPGWTTTVFTVFDAPAERPSDPPYVEYQFTNGEQRLQVSFYAEGDFAARADHSRQLVDVRGTTGRLLDYGAGRFRVNLIEHGRTWEADGAAFASGDTFLDLVETIQHVDERTWKASLPREAVARGERADTVDKILIGVPIPPGLDVEALRTKNQPNSWYHLGAEVLGAVECAWIRQWLDADPSTTQRPQAVTALGGVASWPAWVAMRAEGDYPDVAVDYAQRAVRGDRAGLAGYEDALGC